MKLNRQQTKFVTPWLGIAVGLFLVVVGGSILGFTWVKWRQCNATLRWPSVQGTLLGVGHHSARGGGFSTAKYLYEVHGVVFTNSLVHMNSDADQNGMLLEGRNTGDTIAVFYDPRNPRASVLIKGGNALLNFGFVVGGFLLVFGLLTAGLCLSALRCRREFPA